MKIDLQTLIIPITSSLVGLFPFLINLIVNTIDKRSQKVRLNGVLQQVNNRVAFLTAWYTLQKEVANPASMEHVKNAVSEELSEAFELFIDATLDPDEDTRQRKAAMIRYRKTNKLQRFFLLYQPYNASGWFFHTLYYMCALPLLAVLFYMVYGYVAHNDIFYQIPEENFLIAGVVLIFLFVFRSFGRKAAKDVEDRIGRLEQRTTPLKASQA